MLKAVVFVAAIVAGEAHDLTGKLGEEGLKEVLKMAEEAPEALMELITASGLSTIVPTFSENAGEATTTSEVSDLPFVLGHGMGDSCFNPGMKSITTAVGKHAGVYSTCIPTGDTQASDSNNGFFMNMNKNVEVFAQKIKADPKLANGFYCIGFSQGNNLCRGYIQKYNDPPVKAHLSVHGPVAGVAGFPNCNPSKNKTLAPFCDLFASFLDVAYTEFMQNHLFQGNYYRDPRKLSSSGFKKYSQIGRWNNEIEGSVNATFKTNFEKTKMYVMVEALKDTMVYPNEGEHWGQFTTGGFKDITTMKDTEWYTKNLFGLQTIDAAGGISFETTPGNHLQFTEEQLFGWLDKYILKKAPSAQPIVV